MRILTSASKILPKLSRSLKIWPLVLCLTPGAISCAPTRHLPPPPLELLAPIDIPDREAIATVGDMARVLLADEEVMRLKNIDLAAARQWLILEGATEAGHD